MPTHFVMSQQQTRWMKIRYPEDRPSTRPHTHDTDWRRARLSQKTTELNQDLDPFRGQDWGRKTPIFFDALNKNILTQIPPEDQTLQIPFSTSPLAGCWVWLTWGLFALWWWEELLQFFYKIPEASHQSPEETPSDLFVFLFNSLSVRCQDDFTFVFSSHISDEFFRPTAKILKDSSVKTHGPSNYR